MQFCRFFILSSRWDTEEGNTYLSITTKLFASILLLLLLLLYYYYFYITLSFLVPGHAIIRRYTVAVICSVVKSVSNKQTNNTSKFKISIFRPISYFRNKSLQRYFYTVSLLLAQESCEGLAIICFPAKFIHP
jgi:hypothetical protein